MSPVTSQKPDIGDKGCNQTVQDTTVRMQKNTFTVMEIHNENNCLHECNITVYSNSVIITIKVKGQCLELYVSLNSQFGNKG